MANIVRFTILNEHNARFKTKLLLISQKVKQRKKTVVLLLSEKVSSQKPSW